tara:strand:+ start:3849 stop:10256 length:6408 start_codon:yes stop_codon:yes gene_type:complete
MAEKRFIKGLFKDTSPIDQPPGTWRYARNMVLNDTDGAVSNEGGTQLSGFLGDVNFNNLYRGVGDFNIHVIGKIEVDKDRIILFSLDITQYNLNKVYRSEIGMWEDNVYTTLFNPNIYTYPEHDLKFDIKYLIEGTFKIDSKGDLIVYWTDDFNSPRAFNIDRQLRWIDSNSTVLLPQEWLYSIDPSTTHKNHIDLLNLFPSSGPIPHIDLHEIYDQVTSINATTFDNQQNSVITGGGLLTGVYYLGLAYVDDDLVSTNYLSIANPVSIVDEYDHTTPTSKKDGARHGSQTSKSISWKVSNLNTDYKYMSPIIIRKMGDATEAFKLGIIEILTTVNAVQDVVFSGLEGFTPSSVKDVIIDTISYETAKTINQLDGVLYLGNLSGTKDLGYQKYANNIKLLARTKVFPRFDTFYATLDNLTTGFGTSEVNSYDSNGDGTKTIQEVDITQSYRYAPNIFKWKGYQRDEVYAFYIAFILNDGSMSYAYHIPGRAPLDTTKNIDKGTGSGYSILENSLLNSPSGSGSTNLTTQTNSYIYEDLQELNKTYAKNFHFFDTSDLAGSNNMNYWENATEVYPSSENYDIWDEDTFIDSLGVIQNPVGTLKNKNVRHHHFPSNQNRFFTVVQDFGVGNSSSGWINDSSAQGCESVLTDALNVPGPQPWNMKFFAYNAYKPGPVRQKDDGDWYGTITVGGIDIDSNWHDDGPNCDDHDYGTVHPHYGDIENPLVIHKDKITSQRGAHPYEDYSVVQGTGVHPIQIASPNNKLFHRLKFDAQFPYEIECPFNTVPNASYDNQAIGLTSQPSKGSIACSNHLWDGNKFTADQSLIVTVQIYAWLSSPISDYECGTNNGWHPFSNNDNNSVRFVAVQKRNGVYFNAVDMGGISSTYDDVRECRCSADDPNNYKNEAVTFGRSQATSRTFILANQDELHFGWINTTKSLSVFHPDCYKKAAKIDFPYSTTCDDPITSLNANGEQDGDVVSGYNVSQVSNSQISFKVQSPGGSIDPEMQRDVKIQHRVAALGFTLDDIKIPKTIADKIQGFRIYHAKRTHGDKTVLGQAPAIPMRSDVAKIGLCKAAWDSGESTKGMQIMQTLQTAAISIIRKDPFPSWDSYYKEYDFIYQGQGNIIKENAYKAFHFPDFHLLRTKSSLSGATHIKPQYFVTNYAWQGPTIERDKKMISKIVEDSGSSGQFSPPLKRIEQEWGHDSVFNCYAQYVQTAFFIGAKYQRFVTDSTKTGYVDKNSLPRVLGQKAITYLRGDSIFKAENLGFGGTIVNEEGESTLAYSLKDRHEIFAKGGSITGGGCYSGSTYSGYGRSHQANPFMLTANPLKDDGTTAHVGASSVSGCNRSSYIQIHNLNAFKTDVYKAIDDQELIWTGFEVLGQDINNFIFWDQEAIDKLPASAPTHTRGEKLAYDYVDLSGGSNPYNANFSLETLQKDIIRNSSGNVIDPGDTSTTTSLPQFGQHHIFGGDTYICRSANASAVTYQDNQQSEQPIRTLHYHIVESTDNINFRHTESDNSLYFPAATAKSMLELIGKIDLNHIDNIKYNSNYSELNDIRPAFPLPIQENKQDSFPTRTHRSVKTDTTSLIDNYRLFKANQFKDLPKNRGDLWKLSTFNNLLYFHMEQSLYAAKGKQSMSMKDGSEAFVGSGDIFTQDPDEMVQTSGGFGGTQSQWAALTTRYGYFFVDINTRKIFLVKDKIEEISSIGMENWFKDNIKFELEDYGYIGCSIDNPSLGFGFHSVYDPKHKRIIFTKKEIKPTQLFKDRYLQKNGNSPTNCGTFRPMGYIRFNSSICQYEQWVKNKAGICVFQPIPFKCDDVLFECGGWTISYYPDLKVWGSFHDYIPYMYFNTSTDFYSITNTYNRPVFCTPLMISEAQQLLSGSLVYPDSVAPLSCLNQIPYLGTTYGNSGIWKHNSGSKGILYQEHSAVSNVNFTTWKDTLTYYPFEFEFISNETKSVTSLCSSFTYTLQTFNNTQTLGSGLSPVYVNTLEHGFTKFYLYNTFQISAKSSVTQLNSPNTIEGEDLEYLVNIRRVGNSWKVNNFRDMAALAIDTRAYYTSPQVNLLGGINTGTVTTSFIEDMFTVDGMSEIINPNYIDITKNWNEQSKFIDKWVGIRLIYNNVSNNLLNLYSTEVAVRNLYR